MGGHLTFGYIHFLLADVFFAGRLKLELLCIQVNTMCTSRLELGCCAVSGMKTPSFLLWLVYPLQTGLPTGFYSRVLNYKDNKLLHLNFNKNDYIRGAVSVQK